MIVSLPNKIKQKRKEKNLTFSDIQKISFEQFDEVINEDYLQKVEKGKYTNLELWTLYKLSSILETNIFFSTDEKLIELEINREVLNLKYHLFFPVITTNYTKDHKGIEYKAQFLSLIGTYIKDSRKKLQLTQDTFSKKTKVSRSTIQRLESGSVSPKLNTIIYVLFTIYKLKNKKDF